MTNNVLLVGHSLVGLTMPQMLTSMLAAQTPGRRADHQVINGAPLSYNWDHGASAQGVNARAVLPSGAYNTLILTEAIPLDTHLRWSNTHGTARKYADVALAANPATKVMIYETWHPMTTAAAWRSQLTTDLSKWQGIVTHLNSTGAADQPPATLVPAGQAMARMYDTIIAGNGQGLTSISPLFSDAIHLTTSGNYFVSLVHMAAVTGRSTVGLNTQVKDAFGITYTGWTDAQARLFQHVAWEAAALTPGTSVAAGTVLPTLYTGTALGDTHISGAGDDRLYGGVGNDSLTGGNGQDLISGGSGNDTLNGGRGHDWLDAVSGADLLVGGAGNDTLIGGTGNDVLAGSIGNDRMIGNAGLDTLRGEGGNDLLTGGLGADRFVFSFGSGVDLITDFNASQGDRLLVSHTMWGGGLTAQQVVTQFAVVRNGDVVLDFGTNEIILDGIASTTGLAAWITLF